MQGLWRLELMGSGFRVWGLGVRVRGLSVESFWA